MVPIKVPSKIKDTRRKDIISREPHEEGGQGLKQTETISESSPNDEEAGICNMPDRDPLNHRNSPDSGE
jgi:hypothetical protein